MGKRVLIVDDDEAILRLLEYSLKKLGSEYEIHTARNSLEALEQIEKELIQNEEENCTKNEYSFHQFSRSFTLPESADVEKIEAKSENGILKIVITKKEEKIVKAPREIEIK